jgi:hypothetical protein
MRQARQFLLSNQRRVSGADLCTPQTAEEGREELHEVSMWHMWRRCACVWCLPERSCTPTVRPVVLCNISSSSSAPIIILIAAVTHKRSLPLPVSPAAELSEGRVGSCCMHGDGNVELLQLLLLEEHRVHERIGLA